MAGNSKTVTSSLRKGNSNSRWFQVALLAVLPFILYWLGPLLMEPSSWFDKDFVLDDQMVLSENYYVKQGTEGIGKLLTENSFEGYMREQYIKAGISEQVSFDQYLESQEFQLPGGRYRPLSLIIFALEYEVYGVNIQLTYLINLLLYSLTGILIFLLFLKLLPAYTSSWLSVAFLTALLFVLHPIHTEVVANVKSLDEILALLLSLGTLWFTTRFLEGGGWLDLVWAGLLFFPGLMAKETTITFLAVIPLAAWFFQKATRKQLIQATLPLVGVTILYLIFRTQAIGYLFDSGQELQGLMNDPFMEASGGEKYATIFYSLLLYIKLLFFPHPLTHDYYPYQIPLIDWSDPRAIMAFLVYAALIVYAIVQFKKRSLPVFSVLFYLITLSIVSNVVLSVGTMMNERFLYMPSLGFCLLIGHLLSNQLPKFVPSKVTARRIGFGVLIVIVTGFGWKTINRVPDWTTNATLNKAAIKVSTGSARANQFYAYSLYRQGLEVQDPVRKRALFDEAWFYVNRSLSIYPTYSEALKTKAGLLAGYYQMDGTLEPLLNGFYEIQLTHPIDFVDQYLNYLDGRADRNRMRSFYQQLGNALINVGSTSKGNYYLQKAGS